MNFFEGQVLAFDKPYRASSFNVVYGVRNTLSAHMGGRKIKVGHAGTLDPLATGVLLICTGRATKRIEELQQMGKEYVATLKLGATTASYDMEHPENAVFPTEHITEQLVLDTLQRFVGDIQQIPPVYSACKIEGKRSYHLARRGKEIWVKKKPNPTTFSTNLCLLRLFFSLILVEPKNKHNFAEVSTDEPKNNTLRNITTLFLPPTTSFHPFLRLTDRLQS